MTMDEALEDVEWHDAILSRIALDGDAANLEFRQVIIYRRLGLTTYGMDLCAAVLELGNARVTADSLERTTRDAQWVSDCTLSEPVEAYDLQSWLHGVGPGRLEFLMLDCSEIQLTFETARLKLVGPFRRERIWEGPLR